MTKPIKRHPSIIEYSKDHHYGLLLVWKIRQGLKKNIEPHRIIGYIDIFTEKVLLPHFEEEEEFMLPLLPISDAFRKQVENEHLQLRQLLEKIKNGDNIQSTLKEFSDLLEAHIRFEERLFFPHLEKEVDLDQTQLLSNKKVSEANNIDLEWTDNFWETANKKISYETVSEAILDLTKRGYISDFSIQAQDECIICNKTSLSLSPNEFKIDEIHRFDGSTDPGDEMIVYAISSPSHKIKGFLVNAYGMYANESTSQIIELLEKSIHKG